MYETTKWILGPKVASRPGLAKITARGVDPTMQEAMVQRACLIHKPDDAVLSPAVCVCKVVDESVDGGEESLVYESDGFYLRLR